MPKKLPEGSYTVIFMDGRTAVVHSANGPYIAGNMAQELYQYGNIREIRDCDGIKVWPPTDEQLKEMYDL